MKARYSLTALLLLFGVTAVVAQSKPLVVAHRGGAKEFTENTIAGFQRAAKLGVAAIETDIRLTKDGVVVIYHDDNVGRVEGMTFASKGPLVADVTYAELTTKVLKPVGEDKGGRKVPTLQEVLDQIPTVLLNVELKRCPRFGELVDKTIAILKNHPALDRVVLEAPDLVTAQKLREGLGNKLKLHINPGYDSSVPYEAAVKKVIAFKPHSLSISYKKLSWEIVDLAHKSGVEVWVWTVDDPGIAQAAALLGADAIKTDKPTMLLGLFRKQ
ncbi:MAG TPA: glycerophosphodiester phosphodiesterase family protein [Blastocatellia bacterium]|nr:glycerophosphodiester phosphodiesterase family protein [Blastocatellia bacterium]